MNFERQEKNNLIFLFLSFASHQVQIIAVDLIVEHLQHLCQVHHRLTKTCNEQDVFFAECARKELLAADVPCLGKTILLLAAYDATAAEVCPGHFKQPAPTLLVFFP